MGLRAISVSKILVDDSWHELSAPELGAKEQHYAYSLLTLKATGQRASVRIKIVGYDLPQKLVFQMNSRLRIGSGMIIYNEHDIFQQDTKSLELGSLDAEF